jgi:hypothetical protein
MFSSNSDLGLKASWLAGFVRKVSHAYIYKNAHPCQENFTRHFASARFLGIVYAGKDAKERREAQGVMVYISFSPAFFLVTSFVFIRKCPRIRFFHFTGGWDLQ